MLIVMNHTATQADIDKVIATVSEMGFTAAPIPGGERTAIGVLGNKGYVDDTKIRDLPVYSRRSMFQSRTSWFPVIFTRKTPLLMWPESRSVKASGPWWWVVPVRLSQKSRS
jgi:hypothetical protein